MRNPLGREGLLNAAILICIVMANPIAACSSAGNSTTSTSFSANEKLIGEKSTGQEVAPDVVGKSVPRGSLRVEKKSQSDGYVQWCSSGGAPIVGLPVVDERERAYVATSDGYLHAFERDGRFRWSYTVKGTPLGSVSLRSSDGVILMGTTRRFVYAINQSGALHWTFRTLTPVWSGLFALNARTVVFLGHDRRLYALANSTGGARYRVRAPGAPMGGPIVAPHDVVWVSLADGVARFESALKLEKFPLSSAVEQLVVVGERALARAGGVAYVIEEGERPRVLGEAHFLASDGQRAAVFSSAGGAQMLDLEMKNLTTLPKNPSRSSTKKHLSSPPVLHKDHLWLPYDDGSLGVRALSTGHEETMVVSDVPLSTPVVGASGAWALVPDQGGRFCAVSVPRVADNTFAMPSESNRASGE